MKKLFTLLSLLVLLLISIPANAITIDDIQSNPNRYRLIAENRESAVYMDNSSINVIRYSPPYYNISGTFYFILYEYKIMSAAEQIYSYDLNDRKNIYMTTKMITDYTFDGKILRKDPTIDRQKFEIGTNGYTMGNTLFKKVYNMDFFSP